jgi:hypothetical protein
MADKKDRPKPKKDCTIWRCPHVSGQRPDHCADPMCSNYYQKCPYHR